MAFALAVDGFRLAGYRPEVISALDVRNAELVVAIDTDLPPEARESDAPSEVWNGFPPMREEYFPSRAALKARVESLVERLAAMHARLHGGTSDPVVHEPADTPPRSVVAALAARANDDSTAGARRRARR
jgi:hypothetical protein